MTTPENRKTVQVSADVHTGLYNLASDLELTADGVLRRLLDKATVHIPCTDVQRARWQKAADAAGLTVEDYVICSVESTIRYGQAATLDQIFYRVDMLCRQAGLTPAEVAKRKKRQSLPKES